MENHFSHVLEIVWISAPPKLFKKPINLKYLCFSILFPYYGNPLFPCSSFGNCMECYVFSYISLTIGNHFPHDLETILLMWKLMENFYFWSHFHTNVYMKLFTKEVNLFCSCARPNICISDPFVIEIWKYIQYRRVGSVFYGSDSIAIFLWIWKLEFV